MIFKDREEAGRELGRALEAYRGPNSIVLGIPRGGVAVGYEVARELGAPLDAIVVRKIPVPWNPEAGFGAVGPDGTVTINEEIMPYLALSSKAIDRLAAEVYEEVRRRMRVYRGDRPEAPLTGRVALVVDDGLATGVTMVAALRSARNQGADKVIAASPVASGAGVKLIQPDADEVVCLYTHPEEYPFAVAAFYRQWTDMTDAEVIDYLSRPTSGPSIPGRESAS